jgi:hypothetical protein
MVRDIGFEPIRILIKSQKLYLISLSPLKMNVRNQVKLTLSAILALAKVSETYDTIFLDEMLIHLEPRQLPLPRLFRNPVVLTIDIIADIVKQV